MATDLASCPEMPAQAWAVMVVADRGAAWRMLREAGPVLRHGDTLILTRRPDVVAALHDPALDVVRLHRHHRNPEAQAAIKRLFAPQPSRRMAQGFRPIAATLIDLFTAAGGGDAITGVTNPMAAAMFAYLGITDIGGAANGIPNLAHQLGFTLYELSRWPELPGILARQPELTGPFIEETMRLEPSVHFLDRRTTRPTTIAGVGLPAGAGVVLLTAAIARDHSDPLSGDELLIGDTRAGRHWAFGAGPHRCPGAHFVRETLKIVVAEWVARTAGRVQLDPAYRPEICVPAGSLDGGVWLADLPLRIAAE